MLKKITSAVEFAAESTTISSFSSKILRFKSSTRCFLIIRQIFCATFEVGSLNENRNPINGQSFGRRLFNAFNRLDERYLAPLFTRKQRHQSDMKRLFEELIIAEHLEKMYATTSPEKMILSTGQNGDVVINLTPAVPETSPMGNGVAVINSSGVGKADLSLLVPPHPQHRRNSITSGHSAAGIGGYQRGVRKVRI